MWQECVYKGHEVLCDMRRKFLVGRIWTLQESILKSVKLYKYKIFVENIRRVKILDVVFEYKYGFYMRLITRN